MSGDVVVIIGVGGMGEACARRLGNGRRLLLADISENVVGRMVTELDVLGFDVRGTTVDVSDAASVAALAADAAALGRVVTVVHTAGLSPTMASVERILAVDLVGTAHVIDAFEATATRGLVLVVIASMSGSLMPVAPDVERTLAIAPTDELPTTGEAIGIEHPGMAYSFAKRGNQLRVKASAERWGRRGARIVSISPGVISTAMGRQELEGESGEAMRYMVSRGGVDRLGTAEDIASAAAWLASSEASFVTGIDLLVDGGVVAGVTSPQ